MKSGLGDRNNVIDKHTGEIVTWVSMKSGLGDRNNIIDRIHAAQRLDAVSMKSGLGDRNNSAATEYVPGKWTLSQ